MAHFRDHPLRDTLASELHARPFYAVSAPGKMAYLAFMPERNAASRDRMADQAALSDLLQRHGVQGPQEKVSHFLCDVGDVRLKWECHSEFVSYTIFATGLSEEPFDPAVFDLFPQDWIDAVPGDRVTSIIARIENEWDEDKIATKVADWFVPECVATSFVLDHSAAIAGDFRLDSNGHMRMAVFVAPQTGQQRIGRIVQRLAEIETYKTLAMLGLERSRELSQRLAGMEEALTDAVADMSIRSADPENTLDRLLGLGKALEDIAGRSAFRFDATAAYAALVRQRIRILDEDRFLGAQTFHEFMQRRFDPSMRTVQAAQGQLGSLEARAMRAAELLRTQVDVARSAQSQELLKSMDRRADLQLRLQKTVEGLSVVAISYYALNLLIYFLAPLAEAAGISKTITGGALVIPVVLAVWMVVRRIRRQH